MISITGKDGNSKVVGTPIHYGNRVIGQIIDGGPGRRVAVFFVTSKNWYRMANGFTVDVAVLDSLEGQIDRIEFLDKRASRREAISYDAFMARAWATKDYGFGRKYACDSRYYDGHQPPPTISKPPTPQPTLFPMPSAVAMPSLGSH
jgi:hypothetical protein